MTNYYLDPAGNDAGDGRTEAAPWRTLARAAQVALQPGDSLLLLRGGTWTARTRGLTLSRSGVSTAPITIGAYGTGPRPVIQLNPGGMSGEQQGIYSTGASYLSLRGLHIRLVNPFRSPEGREPDGQNVKLGWYVGFNITGNYIIVDDCEVSNMALGISLSDATSYCTISNNVIHNLDTFWRLGGAAGPMGAIAIMPHGDDHQIYGNVLEDNFVECIGAADGLLKSYGAPFELYNLNRAHIHHNRGTQFRKSIEAGLDVGKTCDDNIIEDNVFVSDRIDARGPNIHGTAAFGPVRRTIIRRNTVKLTGARSESMVINQGAAGTQVYDNILQAVTKAIFLGVGGGVEHHNLYWGGIVQLMGQVISPTSKKLDPKLDSNYRPLPGSPALGMATDGGAVGARLTPQGVDLMPVIAELLPLEATLRTLAAAKAAEAATLTAQADKLASVIVQLKAADDQLDAAANIIDPA